MRASPTTSRCGPRWRRWGWEYNDCTYEAKSLFSLVDAFGVPGECPVPLVHAAGERQDTYRMNSHSMPDSSMMPHD